LCSRIVATAAGLRTVDGARAPQLPPALRSAAVVGVRTHSSHWPYAPPIQGGLALVARGAPRRSQLMLVKEEAEQVGDGAERWGGVIGSLVSWLDVGLVGCRIPFYT